MIDRLRFTKAERKEIKKQVLFLRRDVRNGGWYPSLPISKLGGFNGAAGDKWQTRVNKAHAILQRFRGQSSVGSCVDLTINPMKPLSRRPVIARLRLNGRSYKRHF